MTNIILLSIIGLDELEILPLIEEDIEKKICETDEFYKWFYIYALLAIDLKTLIEGLYYYMDQNMMLSLIDTVYFNEESKWITLKNLDLSIDLINETIYEPFTEFELKLNSDIIDWINNIVEKNIQFEEWIWC